MEDGKGNANKEQWAGTLKKKAARHWKSSLLLINNDVSLLLVYFRMKFTCQKHMNFTHKYTPKNEMRFNEKWKKFYALSIDKFMILFYVYFSIVVVVMMKIAKFEWKNTPKLFYSCIQQGRMSKEFLWSSPRSLLNSFPNHLNLNYFFTTSNTIFIITWQDHDEHFFFLAPYLLTFHLLP